ncbi:MAG: DNA translocase FtsK [Nitrospinae bacterium]|nr:DNA translocase FtsK [Nitrospinota bacterium]
MSLLSGNMLFKESIGIILIAFAIFTTISLISYNPNDLSWFKVSSKVISVKNYTGPYGAQMASYFIHLIGSGAYLIPLFTAICGVTLFRNKGWRSYIPLILIWLSLSISLCSLLYMRFLDIDPIFKDVQSGGILGEIISMNLLKYFNKTGSYLIVITILLLSLITVTRISVISLFSGIRDIFLFLFKRTLSLKSSISNNIKGFLSLKSSILDNIRMRIEMRKKGERLRDRKIRPSRQIGDNGKKRRDNKRRASSVQEEIDPLDTNGDYQLPPLSLLDHPLKLDEKRSRDEFAVNADILEKKLKDFGVNGKVLEVVPGPVITRYEFEPASGVKVSKIMGLSDDLALGMKALSVRILAPVPGKSVVGIEIPNVKREIVYLSEILSSDEFRKSQATLPLGLGKDISGNPIVTDLAIIPHLLVAGATGSGKSVGVNSMICSLLFNATPEEINFIMIDPKMLELSVYDGIPHLISPVVVDPKKASIALKWVVEEMERRYRLLSEKGVRNIDGYNRLFKEDDSRQKREAKGQKKDHSLDHTLEVEVEVEGEGGGIPPSEEKRLSYIIVVIDELADLMIVSSRDVEDSLARLAQMARASGIHLILATQRPSVDVLTGTIKANFPARISFQVSSRTDSRTILDCAGAERLLGKGDFLFLPPGTSRLQRIHGALVSEVEIKRVVDFLKREEGPVYNDSILKARLESKEDDEGKEGEEYDEKYDEAVALVARTRQASISMIQRRLRVGYNRAARMIEVMEKEGVIGPSDGVKPRDVYVKDL